MGKIEQGNKPHLIVLIGLPGVGKSTFAARFSETFNATYVNYLDIQALARDDESLAEEILNFLFNHLIKLKQTIVIDGPGDTLAERKEIMTFAEKSGYSPLFIWVQTDMETAETRAIYSKTATMDEKEFKARVKLFQAPTKKEPVFVISGKHTFVSQARSVLKRLSPTTVQVQRSQARPSAPRAKITVVPTPATVAAPKKEPRKPVTPTDAVRRQAIMNVTSRPLPRLSSSRTR
jgi:predicted kinase